MNCQFNNSKADVILIILIQFSYYLHETGPRVLALPLLGGGIGSAVECGPCLQSWPRAPVPSLPHTGPKSGTATANTYKQTVHISSSRGRLQKPRQGQRLEAGPAG